MEFYCFRCESNLADAGRLYCQPCRQAVQEAEPRWKPCLPLSAYGDTGGGLTAADVAYEVSKQLAPFRETFGKLSAAVQSQAAELRDLKGLVDWLESREMERMEPSEAEAVT
jgi:hypothetical protein